MNLESANQIAGLLSAISALMGAAIALLTFQIYRRATRPGAEPEAIRDYEPRSGRDRLQQLLERERSRRVRLQQIVVGEISVLVILLALPLCTGLLFLDSLKQPLDMVSLFSRGELARIGAALLLFAIPRIAVTRFPSTSKLLVVYASVLGVLMVMAYIYMIDFRDPPISPVLAASTGLFLYLYSGVIHVCSSVVGAAYAREW